MTDTYPIECMTPRVTPNVNHGLCVTVMWQCGLISCNQCTILVEMLIMGEAMHVQGREVYRKSLYLVLNFAMNLKLIKKIKSLKKFW